MNKEDSKIEDRVLLFSRELAIRINKKRPDVTASIIIYGLFTWQISSRSPFGYNPTINGKRACYRSLRQLEEEYPWWNNNTILKAINRAEVALENLFVVQRDKRQLHFQISDKLIKKYNFISQKNGLVRFKRSDAIKYGVLEAVILRNLEYVIDPKHNINPVIDEFENIYRELSPAKLTREVLSQDGDLRAPLPVSRGSVSKAIKYLKSKGAIKEHTTRNGFYTITSAIGQSELAVAKVSADVMKVSNGDVKVSKEFNELCHKPFKIKELHRNDVVLDSKIDNNRVGKCVLAETPELRSNASAELRSNASSELRSNASATGALLPPNMKKLMELVAQDLVDFQKKLENDPEFPDDDLFYDFISIDFNTGKPHSRRLEIDYTIDQLKTCFIVSKVKYTNDDITSLRKLFKDNPLLNYDNFVEMREYLLPQANEFIFGDKRVPKKGHDRFYFSRRIRDLKSFLRYLPQLIMEYFVLSEDYLRKPEQDEKGKLVFDYSDMKEPFLSMAFDNDKNYPIKHEVAVVKCEVSGVDIEVNRPIYYDEFVGRPTIETAEFDCNPMTGEMYVGALESEN